MIRISCIDEIRLADTTISIDLFIISTSGFNFIHDFGIILSIHNFLTFFGKSYYHLDLILTKHALFIQFGFSVDGHYLITIELLVYSISAIVKDLYFYVFNLFAFYSCNNYASVLNIKLINVILNYLLTAEVTLTGKCHGTCLIFIISICLGSRISYSIILAFCQPV